MYLNDLSGGRKAQPLRIFKKKSNSIDTKGEVQFCKNKWRGGQIVADGWAGTSNPYSHLMPPPHTQHESKMLVFPLLDFSHFLDMHI